MSFFFIKKYIVLFGLVSPIFIFSFQEAKAAPCPVGGSQTLVANCEMPATASYTDLTIPAGIDVTAPVGQKIDIIVSGTLSIQAGGGIDVSGKGNNAAGAGANGPSTGSACVGVFGGGGGGGGYGGTGGTGGTDATAAGGAGGITYGSANSPDQLGSAGGLGGGNASGNGMGGGAVKITAGNIILNGYIKANGGNGSDPRANDGSGAGGGGSGGSIWFLASSSFNFTGGNLEAQGGNGGTDGNCGGWDGAGGGGGGGRISIQYKGPKVGAGTYNITKGAGGAGPQPGSAGIDGTFYEDPCYQNFCDNYCGGVDNMTGYSGGSCNAITGNCDFTAIKNCIDADSCTFDSCENGICGNANLCGGLVPCGRLVKGNDPNIDMTKPCTLCALFYMLKNIINFVMTLAIGVGVFILVIAGLLYATAAGNTRKIELAKSAVTSAIIGISIIFIAWMAIAVILQGMGYANMTTWNQVNCVLPI